MARTLNIRANEVVLDPMCGAGGLLLEAARGWPGTLYRDTSLIRNRLLLGPYSRTMPRALRWS